MAQIFNDSPLSVETQITYNSVSIPTSILFAGQNLTLTGDKDCNIMGRVMGGKEVDLDFNGTINSQGISQRTNIWSFSFGEAKFI